MQTDRQAAARAAIARRSPVWFAAFAQIFTRALRRDFHAVRLSRAGAPPPTGTPHLVVYCNHPSWWDATVIALLLARIFPRRPGFAPIDAAMLARYGFMSKIGAFGVEQNARRGAAAFLGVGTEIVRAAENVLFVTAQGRFTDPRERPVRLAPGLVHLVDSCDGATFVPLAVEYPFWDERKPELLLRFGTPLHARDLRAASRPLRATRLAEELELTMDALALEAIARDPAAFQSLLAGRAGVGGVYDLWRRGRAALRGEHFVAAHGRRS